MKILTNFSAIQNAIKSNQKTESSKKNDNSLREVREAIKDKVDTTAKQNNISKTQSMQQEYLNSRQLFGALTQLAEALEIFGREPSKYESSIKDMISNISKDFPQISRYTDNLADIDTTKVEALKKELSADITKQKKAIAFQLITAQNRESMRDSKEVTQTPKVIIDRSNVATMEQTHTPRSENIIQLLS